jgi:hypothetical protein
MTAMNNDIRRAVAILRESPTLKDQDIYKLLVSDGVERQSAALLVVFLPMVYCRLLLANSGARFSDKYRSVLPDGTMSPLKRLASEPIWNEAMEFAEAEIKSGVIGEDVIAIAGHGAEFHATNRLLERGSKLDNVTFDAPAIRWPALDSDVEI